MQAIFLKKVSLQNLNLCCDDEDLRGVAMVA